MGTRSITVVSDQSRSVFLYKHWDGYPEDMLSNFRRAKCFMEKYEDGYLPHFMTYPDDVAAAIIVSFWLDSNKGKTGKIRPPDFRPEGGFDGQVLKQALEELGRAYDAEYIYVIDIQDANEWEVNIYELDGEGYKYVGTTNITCN